VILPTTEEQNIRFLRGLCREVPIGKIHWTGVGFKGYLQRNLYISEQNHSLSLSSPHTRTRARTHTHKGHGHTCKKTKCKMHIYSYIKSRVIQQNGKQQFRRVTNIISVLF
jgi:hypothetical protein